MDMHVCVHVHIHVHVLVHVHSHVHINVHEHMHVYLYAFVYAPVHEHLDVHKHVCMSRFVARTLHVLAIHSCIGLETLRHPVTIGNHFSTDNFEHLSEIPSHTG